MLAKVAERKRRKQTKVEPPVQASRSSRPAAVLPQKGSTLPAATNGGGIAARLWKWWKKGSL